MCTVFEYLKLYVFGHCKGPLLKISLLFMVDIMDEMGSVWLQRCIMLFEAQSFIATTKNMIDNTFMNLIWINIAQNDLKYKIKLYERFRLRYFFIFSNDVMPYQCSTYDT